jgi:hemerythrin-like domain-containing protein
VCTYCGCEELPAIAHLAHEHDEIERLAFDVTAALEAGRRQQASALLANLVRAFEQHAAGEEAGLFEQLRQAGEGLSELDRLVAEHRTFREQLTDECLLDDLARTQRALRELCEHADVEDTDLFPFAQQVLPDWRWEQLTD